MLSTFKRRTYIVGGVLIILGSFLPWWISAGIIGRWIRGFQIYPGFFFEDHGGLLMIACGALIITLLLRNPQPERTLHLWLKLISTISITATLWHLIRFLLLLYKNVGIREPPALAYGFSVVCAGAALLGWTSFGEVG